MKKRFFLSVAVMFAVVSSVLAQTTALVVYDGGYFVKNGDEWVEYRPQDKIGAWNEYEQYRESDTFYFIDSKRCRVAVPKLACDKIFVDRKKNEKWEVVYNTISVHPICPESNGLFYCYTTSSIEYDGYFVRDNGTWREYRPNMKREMWAEFKHDGENDQFFILKSEHNTVYVPRSMDNKFVIEKNDNSSWRGGYSTSAIYDRSAKYDYNFIYKNTFIVKGSNNFEDTSDDARISFDRKGNIQICCNGKFHDLKYRSIKLDRYKGEVAIRISIDEKNNVWILSQNGCLVDCKSIGKKRALVGCDNEARYNEIKDLLSISPILFWDNF